MSESRWEQVENATTTPSNYTNGILRFCIDSEKSSLGHHLNLRGVVEKRGRLLPGCKRCHGYQSCRSRSRLTDPRSRKQRANGNATMTTSKVGKSRSVNFHVNSRPVCSFSALRIFSVSVWSRTHDASMKHLPSIAATYSSLMTARCRVKVPVP